MPLRECLCLERRPERVCAGDSCAGSGSLTPGLLRSACSFLDERDYNLACYPIVRNNNLRGWPFARVCEPHCAPAGKSGRMKTREESLRTIEGKTFDVCVIGGGATGSGCALDSQIRGLKTVQIEAGDFASGASSASTKMVHGGVRYLQEAIRNLDFKEYRVLKEALHERIHMLQNAPFLTNTRFFLTPCYRWFDVAYFATGLKLYDWIAGRDGLGPSTFLSREQALHRVPSLAASGLVGAVMY